MPYLKNKHAHETGEPEEVDVEEKEKEPVKVPAPAKASAAPAPPPASPPQVNPLASPNLATVRLFADYPSPPGNKPFVIGEFLGPSAYLQLVNASPPTGGIQVQAKDIGLVEVEFITAMLSDDGQYELNFTPNNPGRSSRSVTGIVIDANTGAEIGAGVDIHLRSFRFLAVGR